MTGLLTGILGVPPRLLSLELRREIHELRTRARLMHSAVRGAPIAHRLLIDNGTLVIHASARHGSVANCQIINTGTAITVKP